MAKKPTITTLTSGFNSTTTLNNNFTALRNAFDNTLSLDGSTPNAMNADLDMNSNDILNVGEIDVQGLTIDGVAVYPGSTQLATTYATQSYTGNGSTTVYSMGFNPSIKANVNAYIDGVHQNQDAFTISGTSLTFTAAPPLNSAIEIKVPINVTSLTNTDSSVIVYNQGGAGAQDRSVQSRLRDFVSVKDFGAVGDGVTDDRIAIVNSLGAVASGGTVYFPAGTYYISSNININQSNLTIEGNGIAKITHDTAASFDGLLRLNGDRITIRGMKIENTYTVGAVLQIGIEFEGSEHITIENCYFKNFRYCILGRATSTHVNVVGCRFDTEPQGLTACVINGEYVNISNNQVEAFGDTGLGVQGSARYAVIANNVVQSRSAYSTLGIIVEEDAENVIVSNNIIDGKYNGTANSGVQTGIRLADNATDISPRNVIVTGNMVTNCEDYGISLVNTNSYAEERGISAITNANPAVVTSNGAHGLSDDDIITIKNAGGMVEVNDRSFKINVTGGNTFELLGVDSTNYGTYSLGSGGYDTWRGSTNVVITGNIIDNCGSQNVRTNDAYQGVFANNIIVGGRTTGMYMQDTTQFTVAANIASGNAAQGFSPDKQSASPFFGNVSLGNGSNFDFTSPNFTADYGLNIGHTGTQRVGDIIHVVEKVDVTASSTSYLDVQIIEDNGRFSIYEAICFTSTSGAVTAGVEIVTNSNIAGSLNGTVTHGNNTYIDKLNPIAEENNTSGSTKYMRIGVVNADASNHTCFVSIKYRNAGGTA